MDSDARARLLARGLDDIFDPALRESIAGLIDDVRVRGDDAVCDALARFDGIRTTPDRLRVRAAAISSAPRSRTPSPTPSRTFVPSTRNSSAGSVTGRWSSRPG